MTINELISHPNTPLYGQILVLVVGLIIGSRELKKYRKKIILDKKISVVITLISIMFEYKMALLDCLRLYSITRMKRKYANNKVELLLEDASRAKKILIDSEDIFFKARLAYSEAHLFVGNEICEEIKDYLDIRRSIAKELDFLIEELKYAEVHSDSRFSIVERKELSYINHLKKSKFKGIGSVLIYRPPYEDMLESKYESILDKLKVAYGDVV